MTQYLAFRSFRWAMAVLSGLLMVISFPFTGSLFPLVFVSWVPLLLVAFRDVSKKGGIGLFGQVYLTFFIYNLGTTWWIYYASVEGAYMAFFCNSLVMAVAFLFGRWIVRKIGITYLTLGIVSTWLSFEYLHFNWELSWPWLTLGNSFARVPALVQWYQYTGALGGSIWILWVNLLIYQLITQKKSAVSSFKRFRPLILTLSIPVIISLVLYGSYKADGENYEVVVIQPNLDPYTVKFATSDNEQLKHILSLADAAVTPKTALVVAPETALNPTGYIDEAAFKQQTIYHQLLERRAKWHHASFLIGASTVNFFENKHSRASRAFTDGPGYFESYNSSILLREDRKAEIVHKSKLVLGVEKIPFSNWFPSLEEMSINLGGGSGTLGIEDRGATIMKTENTPFAPVICYESIYGEFIAEQCRQKTAFIAVITNDGWWRETPGYLQHFAFSRLRAMENRQYLIRSANTGQSGIINGRGDVIQSLGWWKTGTIKETIHLSKTTTWYAKLGDWIAFPCLAGMLICFGMIVKGWLRLRTSTSSM